MEDKFNREGACQLSPALKKIIHTVKQWRGHHKDTLPSNSVSDWGTAITTLYEGSPFPMDKPHPTDHLCLGHSPF
jgi:hypothetical protein